MMQPPLAVAGPSTDRPYDVQDVLGRAAAQATPLAAAPEDRAAGTADEMERRIQLAVARQHATTMRDEMVLEAMHENFDSALKRQAESERQMNAIRDLATEQLKRDDENLKKWMALI